MSKAKESEIPESIKTHSYPSADSKLDADHVAITEPDSGSVCDYTKDQTVRKHESMPSEPEKGGRKTPVTKSTKVAERHVIGEPGFVERDREQKHVAQRRKETEKVFEEHRKKRSSV